jgi:hypothetical protein
MIKILAMMLMMTLSTEAMAEDDIWKELVPSDPVFRKLYLQNESQSYICYTRSVLMYQIVEQSKPDSEAMKKYKNNIDEYVKHFVNPRLKDIADIETAVKSRNIAMCWG